MEQDTAFKTDAEAVMPNDPGMDKAPESLGKTGKKRQPNIELLRIISMFAILMYHMSYFGTTQFDTGKITANRLWTQILVGVTGHPCLNLFLLISGYFMVNERTLKLGKIARIWLTMLFYSVVSYLAACLFFGFSFSLKSTGIALIPFLYPAWPFASAYLALMLFAPFIGKLLRHLNKNQHRVLIGIIMVVWVLIPTFTTFEAESNYLLWMMSLCIMAAYIRLYPDDFKHGSKWYFTVAAVFAGLTLMSIVALDVIGFKVPFAAKYATHFSGNQCLNVVIMSLSLFIGTLKRVQEKKESAAGAGTAKEKYAAIVNFVASLVFGVFLFHENYYFRIILWQKIFSNNAIQDSPFYILITLGEGLAVFVTGLLVEFLRQRLLENHYMKGVNRLLAKPQAKIDRMMLDKQ